ncbi:MAG: hypothetical protein VXX94_08460, partial [Verrucomicrobiota bacterium]|nr:hypothetical protein [Verrucomicrobiota bacterium]
ERAFETPATITSHSDATRKRGFRIVIRVIESIFHARLSTNKTKVKQTKSSVAKKRHASANRA